MKHLLSVILVVLFALQLVSCEKVLDIDDDAYNQQLVLNGVPSAGKRAFVNFSHTHFFLDPNNSQPVGGAQLTLTVGSTVFTPDSISGCNYFFPHICQPDDTLTINVAAEGHTITAQTYVPRAPQIDGLNISHFPSSSFRFYRSQFILGDHANYPDYYSLNVTVRDSGLRYNPWTRQIDTVDTVHNTYFYLPESNRGITSSDVNPYIPMGGYLYSQLMFTDRNIDGENYPIDLYVLYLIDTNEVNNEVDTFRHWYTVNIETITPARWNYLLSVARSQSSSSFFAEQGQAWSNVSGALGIFAGNARESFSFIPDTLPSPPPSASLPPIPITSALLPNGRP